MALMIRNFGAAYDTNLRSYKSFLREFYLGLALCRAGKFKAATDQQRTIRYVGIVHDQGSTFQKDPFGSGGRHPVNEWTP